MAPGLNHLGYTWRNLEELIDTYARLKGQGVMPTRPIRHGLTLSLYYRDPDGNGLEFQIDLMEAKDANEFMSGPAFAANPIGEPFRPGSSGGAACAGQARQRSHLPHRSDRAAKRRRVSRPNVLMHNVRSWTQSRPMARDCWAKAVAPSACAHDRAGAVADMGL